VIFPSADDIRIIKDEILDACCDMLASEVDTRDPSPLTRPEVVVMLPSAILIRDDSEVIFAICCDRLASVILIRDDSDDIFADCIVRLLSTLDRRDPNPNEALVMLLILLCSSNTTFSNA